ncbi:conserved hypothetical protein [Ricinus communis]|uniref:Uncharacterized protein n=1 Tax=Ricinus communis TaxID=3988 RepID=B9SQG5_RICCO|nr:conserved hypothetical protein [Ricinus communis]
MSESLWKFIERFNKEAIEIEDLNMEIAYTPSKTTSSLMTIVETHIRIDNGMRGFAIKAKEMGHKDKRKYQGKGTRSNKCGS